MKTNAKLATAFALGAASTVVFLKACAGRQHSLICKSFPSTPNADVLNSATVFPVPGDALEPLNTQILIKRSIESFPAGYLLIISIIQSVTLGILLTETVSLLSKPIGPIETTATLSKAVTIFGALVIISYEYLWFIVIMRWAATFRDTLIPYTIGVTEIIPSLLLGQSLSWWISATAIPAISGAALLNTITRLDPRAFIGEPRVFRSVRLLLWRIIICCIVIVFIGMAGSMLVAFKALHGLSLTLAPISLILPAFVAVGINERTLNSVFEAYEITRRPLLWLRRRKITESLKRRSLRS